MLFGYKIHDYQALMRSLFCFLVVGPQWKILQKPPPPVEKVEVQGE